MYYKPRNDLSSYKKSELESTFLKIVNPKKANIIYGMIYRHPSMDVTDFNQNYLNGLLDKVPKEEKNIFLLGDFNINLLNYNEHRPTNNFLDSLGSSSLLLYILQLTQLTGPSKTLIDNIFFNLISHDVISGNITATISDHLPQFLIAPNVIPNPSSNRSNIFERNWSDFNQQNLIVGYISADSKVLLKIEQYNINFSFKTYLSKINSLLDTHASLKESSKYKLKFENKTWMTPCLQKSITVKNKLLKKFIHLKEPHKKSYSHNEYKKYRNMLSSILKRSQHIFQTYFLTGINIKNTLKGITSLITLKDISTSVSMTLNHHNKTVTNPAEFANNFNKYFVSVAEDKG